MQVCTAYLAFHQYSRKKKSIDGYEGIERKEEKV
jgi:hypothetical protein